MTGSGAAPAAAAGVGIVLLSHSPALAAGAADLAGQVSGGAPVVGVGGTVDGRLGTSADLLERGVGEVSRGGGVLVIPDLGSAVLTARAFLADYAGAEAVVLVDAPFVEGAVAAAVAASTGADLDETRQAAAEARDVRKL